MKPEPICCALCLVEDGILTLANSNAPGMPLCRSHFAETHMRAVGIEPYPVDLTNDAPALLQ